VKYLDILSLINSGFYTNDRSGYANFKRDCYLYMQEKFPENLDSKIFQELFDYAWNESHASGYSEVLSLFSDLVTLARFVVDHYNSFDLKSEQNDRIFSSNDVS